MVIMFSFHCFFGCGALYVKGTPNTELVSLRTQQIIVRLLFFIIYFLSHPFLSFCQATSTSELCQTCESCVEDMQAVCSFN